MPQAVEFSGHILNFRFIDIDINVTIDLQSSDFLFIPGFNQSNSVSHINLPKDLFSKLFLYNIRYVDLSNNNYTRMQYAMDTTGWYANPLYPALTYPTVSFQNVPFTKSVIDLSFQIIPGATYQNLKYDYIRFLLKEITGTLYMNGLFRNTDALLQTVISMDTPFNSQIRDILLQCGTTAAPMNTESYYKNPCRVLIESILANDNVLETDNEKRKLSMIASMKSLVNTNYNDNVNTKYYIYGQKLISTDKQYFYPIYVNIPANKNKGYTTITFIDASFSNYTFLIDTSIGSGGSGVNGTDDVDPIYTDYDTIHNYFYNFSFDYGDMLGVRLTYKPKNNIFLGKEIHDYSYEVYLDMGIELVTNVSYSPLGSEGASAIVNTEIVNTDIINSLQANGLNKAFQYLLLNCKPQFEDYFTSPYNFYPTLNDINGIYFETYFPGETITIDGVVFDKSEWEDLFEEVNHIGLDYLIVNTGNDATPEQLQTYEKTHNWIFSIFTRPHKTSNTVGFKRFDTVPAIIITDTWTAFDLTTNLWINQDNTTSTWSDLIQIPIFPVINNIKKNGDQQIMIMSIGTNDPNCNGSIRSVSVSFKDGRIIRMV